MSPGSFKNVYYKLFAYKLYMSELKSALNNPRGCARDVMVIVVGNEHGDTSSNPGRD